MSAKHRGFFRFKQIYAWKVAWCDPPQKAQIPSAGSVQPRCRVSRRGRCPAGQGDAPAPAAPPGPASRGAGDAARDSRVPAPCHPPAADVSLDNRAFAVVLRRYRCVLITNKQRRPVPLLLPALLGMCFSFPSAFAGSFAVPRRNLLAHPFTSPPRFLFLAFHVIAPLLTQQFAAAAFNGLVSHHHLLQNPTAPKCRHLLGAGVTHSSRPFQITSDFFQSQHSPAIPFPPPSRLAHAAEALQMSHCAEQSTVSIMVMVSFFPRLQTGAA